MDENEYNFDPVGSESWMLLALLAMIGGMSNPEPSSDIPQCCIPYSNDDKSFMQADKVTLDTFTIEQMMAAAMNKKEADMNKENDEDAKEDEPDDYRGLYGRSWDV